MIEFEFDSATFIVLFWDLHNRSDPKYIFVNQTEVSKNIYAAVDLDFPS